MRGTLHAAKPASHRTRRNAPTLPSGRVERDDVVRGPALPDGDWTPGAVAWYDTWRRAPQAALFEVTDWQRLRAMLPLVDAYHHKPTAAALSEIRLNEERRGATYVDRLRARIVIDEPGDAIVSPLRPVVRGDV